MPSMTDCALCGPLAGEARASDHWRIVVNRNQNLLGKTMLVLRRHLERVSDLSAEEWRDLHVQLGDVTERLDRAFSPDHYNYAFLQNADRHVHLHVIPRYAEPRELAAERFDDPDWPEHYLPGRERLGSPETIAAISSLLA
jgi:diadenosine tetraphosphate (Ap4A) HIT family hydrolase